MKITHLFSKNICVQLSKKGGFDLEFSKPYFVKIIHFVGLFNKAELVMESIMFVVH